MRLLYSAYAIPGHSQAVPPLASRSNVRFDASVDFEDNGAQLEGAKRCDVTNDSNSEMKCKVVYRLKQNASLKQVVVHALHIFR